MSLFRITLAVLFAVCTGFFLFFVFVWGLWPLTFAVFMSLALMVSVLTVDEFDE